MLVFLESGSCSVKTGKVLGKPRRVGNGLERFQRDSLQKAMKGIREEGEPGAVCVLCVY